MPRFSGFATAIFAGFKAFMTVFSAFYDGYENYADHAGIRAEMTIFDCLNLPSCPA